MALATGASNSWFTDSAAVESNTFSAAEDFETVKTMFPKQMKTVLSMVENSGDAKGGDEGNGAGNNEGETKMMSRGNRPLAAMAVTKKRPATAAMAAKATIR